MLLIRKYPLIFHHSEYFNLIILSLNDSVVISIINFLIGNDLEIFVS